MMEPPRTGQTGDLSEGGLMSAGTHKLSKDEAEYQAHEELMQSAPQ
jgi:hypothetical protein